MVKQASKKQGNEMSTKQVARTVLDGTAITFSFPPSDKQITGYVFGADDYHWAVVEPNGDRHLVHKGAPIVTLLSTRKLHAEPNAEALEPLVAPFRRYVERTYFGRNGADPAREDEREPATCS